MDKFNYKSAKKEKITCNACGKEDFYVLARESSEGYPARTCLCKNCGLICINPRMTKEVYDEYYKYFYREDRARLKGAIREEGVAKVERGFEGGRLFGRALASYLKEFIRPGLTIDIGSNSGGILKGLEDEISGLELLGVEPAAEASAFANSRGIKTFNVLFEDLKEDIEKAENILCVQSLNHLLDPRGFIQWSFNHLKEGGHLILAVKDFRFQCRRGGSLASGIQIDHLFMFTPEVLRSIMEKVGFKVVYEDVDEKKSSLELVEQKRRGLHRHHMRLVGEKVGEGDKKNFDKGRENFKRLKKQLWQPYLRVYYGLVYWRGLRWWRKLVGL